MASSTLASDDWRSRCPFAWLPPAIREPHQPIRAILTGYLLSFVGSILLSLAIQGLLSLFGDSASSEVPDLGSGWMMLFGVVIFAPVVETLIMGTILSVLLLIVSPAAAIAVSAIGWGVAHSLLVPTWGLVIWWPFLIFSTMFVVWRPMGWGRAAALVMVTHAMQNLIPALLVLFAPR